MNRKRIVFIGLASSFTERLSYQDNCLCEVALNKGYDVTYITNNDKYIDGKLREVPEEDYITKKGLHLIRLKYINYGFKGLSKKIRNYSGVFRILESINPNIIYCHGIQYLSVLDVVKYATKNNKVKIFIDSHANYINSGKSWVSLNILHKIYYRYLLKKIEPYIKKFFYIGIDEKKFAIDIYGVNEEKMQYFPLGGFIPTNESYVLNRQKIRDNLGLNDRDVIFLHTGKLDKMKKTKELIEAYINCNIENSKMLIIGFIPKENKGLLNVINNLNTNKVLYIEWISSSELMEYMCACDCYCQPGTPSATLQNAICCYAPCIVNNSYGSYDNYYDNKSIYWMYSDLDMNIFFNNISKDNFKVLQEMKMYTKKFAKKFDYYELFDKLMEI